MARQLKRLTTPTQHNGDLGYYVLDYLAHGFPTQLFESFTDERCRAGSSLLARFQPLMCSTT